MSEKLLNVYKNLCFGVIHQLDRVITGQNIDKFSEVFKQKFNIENINTIKPTLLKKGLTGCFSYIDKEGKTRYFQVQCGYIYELDQYGNKIYGYYDVSDNFCSKPTISVAFNNDNSIEVKSTTHLTKREEIDDKYKVQDLDNTLDDLFNLFTVHSERRDGEVDDTYKMMWKASVMERFGIKSDTKFRLTTNEDIYSSINFFQYTDNNGKERYILVGNNSIAECEKNDSTKWIKNDIGANRFLMNNDTISDIDSKGNIIRKFNYRTNDLTVRIEEQKPKLTGEQIESKRKEIEENYDKNKPKSIQRHEKMWRDIIREDPIGWQEYFGKKKTNENEFVEKKVGEFIKNNYSEEAKKKYIQEQLDHYIESNKIRKESINISSASKTERNKFLSENTIANKHGFNNLIQYDNNQNLNNLNNNNKFKNFNQVAPSFNYINNAFNGNWNNYNMNNSYNNNYQQTYNYNNNLYNNFSNFYNLYNQWNYNMNIYRFNNVQDYFRWNNIQNINYNPDYNSMIARSNNYNNYVNRNNILQQRLTNYNLNNRYNALFRTNNNLNYYSNLNNSFSYFNNNNY